MTSRAALILLLLAAAHAQGPPPGAGPGPGPGAGPGPGPGCPTACMPLQDCAELARISRPEHTRTAPEGHLLQEARARCSSEDKVCCPPHPPPPGGDGAEAHGDGEVEVGSRRLGFGFQDRQRQFGYDFNRWPPAPAPIAGYPFGSSPWGSPISGGFNRPPPYDPFDTNRRPPQNPYEFTSRPPISDYTTTRRPQQQSSGKRTTTHRPSLETSSNDLFPYDVCGSINEDRIVGGNRSSLFEFPWMARLGYTQRFSRRVAYRCGGALINSRYVLTAAHCVGDGNDPDQVRLGELDDQTEIDCEEIIGERVCAPKVVDVVIEKVIPHSDFSSDPRSNNYLKNDVALLRLRSHVKFTDAVKPICLPQSTASNFVGKKAVVAGWGRDRNDKAGGTHILMKASVPVQRASDCAQAYERRGISVDKETQLCAGGENGVDSCQGDSGGPLFRAGTINGDARMVQYGIVSFGLQRCGVEGVPGVYTRVEHFMPWIRANMRA